MVSCQGTIVFHHSLESLPGQVQAIKRRIPLFKFGQDTECLRVVVKSAEWRHGCIQSILPGMTERRMTKVMGQRERLSQIFIQTQGPRDSARNLSDLQRMCETRAVVIALVINEDLCLVLKPPERAGMNNPVAIALVTAAISAFGLRVEPAPRCQWIAGIRRQYRTVMVRARGCELEIGRGFRHLRKVRVHAPIATEI